jgi:hypothetical protein
LYKQTKPTSMLQENETINESTTVEELDLNIDEIFGVGADSIMTPEEEKSKSFFKKETVDTTFLDNPDKQTSTTEVSPESTADIDNLVEETIQQLDELISEEETNQAKGGRPKIDKSGLLEIASKMIEEGSLIPFDDDKPLDEYTAADFRELFEANFQEREAAVKQQVPQEFFNSLPRELQVAAKYVADGGQDLKGLFKTLAQVEEVFELDVTNERDQEEITRQYFYATQFGTPEEIEAEIEDLKDLGRLEKKAEQFKPKLDKMQESIVQHKLAEQEAQKQRQAEAAQSYTENVYNTLLNGELNGLKIDRKTQSMLYSGLVQPNYPSISGRNTNLLGHLLEKYQFVEPRHDLIAEALWLLQDPDGYRSKLKSQGSNETVAKTVKTLKTEEGRRLTSSGTNIESQVRTNSSPKRTLQKPNKNIFSR